MKLPKPNLKAPGPNFTSAQLEDYAKAAVLAAVLAEREACVKLAEQEHAACWRAADLRGAQAAARLAATIRGRK